MNVFHSVSGKSQTDMPDRHYEYIEKN
jgi:hypothetical protein